MSASRTNTAPKANAREKLIAAAIATVRYNGFSATSVDEICAGAGVTKGAFFHHFASKEALAVAAASAWTDIAEQRIFTLPAWTRIADPLDRLIGHIEFRLSMLDGPAEDFTCFVGTVVQEAYTAATRSAPPATPASPLTQNGWPEISNPPSKNTGSKMSAHLASPTMCRRCCRAHSSSPRPKAALKSPATASRT